MTAQEYSKLYNEAFSDIDNLTTQTLKKLKQTYIKSADRIAEQIRIAEKLNRSQLTIQAMQELEASLRKEAEQIVELLDKDIRAAVENGSSYITGTDYAYMQDMLEKAGSDLSREKLARIFTGIDNQVVVSMLTRVYKDGYTYSQRIWKSGAGYQSAIKNIITQAAAEGRDIIKVARDIELYARSGRKVLAKRYGGMGKDSWVKRMPKYLEYNSLRLVRSELYASLQESSKLSGRANPGCNGLYNWKKNTAEKWNCRCEEYERNSPYEYTAIPGYPHSNCLCTLEPVLRDGNVFLRDLKSWVNGNSVDYIDNWYKEFYLTAY